MLGLEDHGGITGTADEVLALVGPAKTDWLGVNLDVGNFEAEDPYEEIRRCAPYAVNVHWKPEMKGWGASGPRKVDWSRVIKILRESKYCGYLAMEYESADDPRKALPVLLQATREVLKSGA